MKISAYDLYRTEPGAPILPGTDVMRSGGGANHSPLLSVFQTLNEAPWSSTEASTFDGCREKLMSISTEQFELAESQTQAILKMCAMCLLFCAVIQRRCAVFLNVQQPLT